jgi:ABC-type nitrate/sulfonate/bicarbonate transport system substrate-binding protein
MVANVVQGVVTTPPLDVRAKNDGYNVFYNLLDNKDLPFIYSSLHASSRTVRERPEVVQRMVAAFAEAINYVDKNPDKTKAAISKAIRATDEEVLQVSYDIYARKNVDRRMLVPAQIVGEYVALFRSLGKGTKREAEDLYDNTFVNDVEKSGYLKELWGSELDAPAR